MRAKSLKGDPERSAQARFLLEKLACLETAAFADRGSPPTREGLARSTESFEKRVRAVATAMVNRYAKQAEV